MAGKSSTTTQVNGGEIIMKQIFFIVCLVFISFTIAKAQNVTDDDKRSFENTAPIEIDVDGDGQPDKIQPRK